MPSRYAIDPDHRIAAIVGAILLTATYCAFSIRAVTDPIAPGDLLSVKRAVIAALGAGLFWLVARYVRRSFVMQAPRRFVEIALVSGLTVAAVLASRIAYDLWISGETHAVVTRNLRWTVIWAGYFGTALLGYCAAILVQSLRGAAFLWRGTRQDRLATVLNEVSTWPVSERRILAAMIDQPARYVEADPLFAAEERV